MNSFFVIEGRFLGFFLRNITRLSASSNFDNDCIWGLTLSLTSVRIISLSFFAIMSKGVFFVSVASNPSSTYFFETAVSNLLSPCSLCVNTSIRLKTWCPSTSYIFIALLIVTSEFSFSYFVTILLVTPSFLDSALSEYPNPSLFSFSFFPTTEAVNPAWLLLTNGNLLLTQFKNVLKFSV